MIKKVITFRASSMGDCLMAKYLLENIHASFPEAKYAIMVGSRAVMIRDLLGAYPWIEILEGNRKNPSGVINLWKKYRNSDLVITQYAGKPGGKFSFISKVIGRFLAKQGGFIGFKDSSKLNDFIYDSLISFKSNEAVVWHEREILKVAKIPLALTFPILVFNKNDSVLNRFGLIAGKFIIIHLFAGGRGRGLHPIKKKELLLTLSRQNPNIQIVVSGSRDDKKEAIEVAKNTSAMIIAGETTLQEMMNIIDQSKGVISLDTGMAHMTAQLGKPLIVLRTCIAPNWWFTSQYGPNAPISVLSMDEICKNKHEYRDYPKCINGISIERIMKTVKERLL